MSIPVRAGIQQRVLPAYRVEFFDALAACSPQGLSIFAGRPQPHEALGKEGSPQISRHAQASNGYLGKMPDCLFWQSNIRAWLNQWQPGVLILEANPRNLSLPGASRWMRARNRPVLGWGLGAPGARSSVAARLTYRHFLTLFDVLIAYSQRGAQQYAAAGFPQERIYVAHNAAARRPYQPPPERPDHAAGSKPVVLFVGRLQARKRLDALLEACAGLPRPLQPEVWIAGDGPARAELEALANQRYPETRFLGDRRGEELYRLFQQADLFVLPGTGGLAVQQAMAAGLPVLVAQGDGTQDDLVRQENGWLIPPGDTSALQAGLQEALANPQRLRQMGRESFRIVADEINLENMVSVFTRAVENALRRRPVG